MMKTMNWNGADAGVFALRLGLAAIFLAHGLQKFIDWEGMVGFFGSLGLSPFVFGAIAVLEVAAGLAMLLGVATRLAGYVIVAIMIGAVVMIHWEMGFFGGWEFNFILLIAAISVSFGGPGNYRLPIKLPAYLN